MRFRRGLELALSLRRRTELTLGLGRRLKLALVLLRRLKLTLRLRRGLELALRLRGGLELALRLEPIAGIRLAHTRLTLTNRSWRSLELMLAHGWAGELGRLSWCLHLSNRWATKLLRGLPWSLHLANWGTAKLRRLSWSRGLPVGGLTRELLMLPSSLVTSLKRVFGSRCLLGASFKCPEDLARRQFLSFRLALTR